MKCQVDVCDREASSKAKNCDLRVCKAHYLQDWANKPFKPIKLKKFLHQDENGRICTACERYKPWSEFYKRSGKSIHQSQCRSCMIKANSESNKRRAQAHDDD